MERILNMRKEVADQEFHPNSGGFMVKNIVIENRRGAP